MKKLVLCASCLCMLSGMALAQDSAVLLFGDDSWQIALQSSAYWDRGDQIVLEFEAWGGTNQSDGAWPDCSGGTCDRGIGLWCGFWNGPMPQTLPDLPCDGDIGNLGCEDADYNFDFVFCPVWDWDWADGPGGIGREGQNLNEDPDDCTSSGSDGQYGEGAAIINAFVNSSSDSRVLVQFVAGTTAGANIRYSTNGGVDWVDEPDSQYANCPDLPAAASAEISIGFIGFGNGDSGGVWIDNVTVWSGGAGGTVELMDDFESGTFSSDWVVTERGDGYIAIIGNLPVNRWDQY